MRRKLLLPLIVLISSFTFAGVTVSSPLTGSTVGSPAHFVASATSPYVPINGMVINVDSKDVYSVYAAKVDTYVNLAAGTHKVLVKAWDDKGTYMDSPLTITVGSGTTTTSGSGVTVSQPANNATVGSTVQFVASASSPYSAINAMVINIDSKDVYTVYSNQINASLPVGAGTHQVYVKAWDQTGHYFDKIVTITAGSSTPAPTGNAVYDIEKMSGWQACSVCAGPGGNGTAAAYWMAQNVANPSLDGRATQFYLGGSYPYSNALFAKPLGGRAGATHFILDFYAYVTNPSVVQGLEMDIFYSRDGKKNYFLTECDSRGTYAGTWQVSDAIHDSWQHTGLPCHLLAYTWNHVVLEFYRLPDGNTNFVSVSMNGDKHYVNRSYYAQNVSSFEMNPAVQLDGDEHQDHYSVWVNKMTVKYW